LGMHAALYRQRPERMSREAWHPDEKLNLAQTIEGYSLGAARAAGWAETIGSISPGKRADLIVLDRDLFSLAESGDPGREIADTQVVMTFFDGELVYEA
jgi:predicted amidohydrolase YtcJ